MIPFPLKVRLPTAARGVFNVPLVGRVGTPAGICRQVVAATASQCCHVYTLSRKCMQIGTLLTP
jgi:hypothetical protein